MRVIGFNFSKITAERMKDSLANVKITTNIDVPLLKDIDSNVLKTKDSLLEATFKYNILYEPQTAKIELEGKILLSMEPKKAQEILKGWKKKKLEEDFKMILFNVVLKRASLRALQLEEELGLPLHVPMPMVRKGNPQDK